MLDPVRWRYALIGSVMAIALGFFGATAALLDAEVIGAAFGNGTYTREWPDIREAIAPGVALMGLGVLASLLAGTGLAAASWVRSAGGAYGWLLSRRARALLASRGTQHPAEHQLARAGMELEERAGGWRPETVLRFLTLTLAIPEAPVERAWLDEIRTWSIDLRVRADEALRSGGSIHLLEVGGVDYPAEDVATLTERIDATIRDLKFKGGVPLPQVSG